MASSENDLDTVIPDEDELLRGVHPDYWSFEKQRPQTGALKTSGEMSVDWGAKRSLDSFMSRWNRREDGHGVVSFVAAFARSCGCIVRFEPNPPDDPENDAHTIVLNTGSNKKFFNECKVPGGQIKILVSAIRK